MVVEEEEDKARCVNNCILFMFYQTLSFSGVASF